MECACANPKLMVSTKPQCGDLQPHNRNQAGMAIIPHMSCTNVNVNNTLIFSVFSVSICDVLKIKNYECHPSLKYVSPESQLFKHAVAASLATAPWPRTL